MKKLYLALSILIITVVFAFAGWESYTQLTSPADGDIITVQDVSVTGVGDGGGKISYLTLSGLWSYINTKAESWLGIDPSALTPDYFLKVNDSGTGIEESKSLDVDITGFSPSMVLYSDASGAVQPHPTVSSQELAQLDGYNTAAGTIEERLVSLSSGGTDLGITVAGEASNDIVATLQIEQGGVAYSDNASIRAWLSETDGGAPGSAFDGDSGDPWVVSDGTALNTYAANYDELLLTGSDGDCVITMQHSDASSPATKYLCGQYRDSVSCAEVTFSADETPCALYEDYSQTSADTGYAITSSISMYQLMKGGPTGVGVCKVRFLAYTSSAAPDKGDIHFEIWSNGGTPAQIGADSTTVEVTSTSTSGAWYEVTFASPPELDGSDWRLVWVIENWQTGLNCYWKANTNEASYESTSYDLIHNGSDQSADAAFEVYTQ